MFSDAFWAEMEGRISDAIVKKIDARIGSPWPRWMTIKTAAQYIDHSQRSVEYLLSKNLFPVVRRDRLVLIDREDIDAALKKLKQ
jgi:excisionase family DNA binding protein